LSRILFAFRSFFSILFTGKLPDDIAKEFGFERPQPPPPVAKPVEMPKVSDGALQMLNILQRDSRLIDFLMEDITGYADDQVGAAVRTLHSDCRASLNRHVTLTPVIDGVEGTFQKLDASKTPASGKVSGGILRHRGWFASSVTLPVLGKQDPAVLTPAELEVE
jgi:hypothetical protein